MANLQVSITESPLATDYMGAVKYDFVEKKLYIKVKDVNWVEIDSEIELAGDDPVWYKVVLIVDFSTKKYVSLHFGGHDYDLSAYDLWHGGDSPTFAITGSIGLVSGGGVASDVWVDNVSILKDVP